MLIEGMTIAALTVGATQGYIYLRSEYPQAHRALIEAIATGYSNGYLGANILGTGKPFDLEIRLGGGAYICGEETAMLERSRGAVGWCASSLPFPRSKDCSASRRSLTTSSRSRRCRSFSSAARNFSANTAPSTRAARYRFNSPAMPNVPA